MHKNISKKDFIVIGVALFAVVAMVIFLVCVQKMQKQEQEELWNEGQEMVEEQLKNQEEQEAEQALIISGTDGNNLEIYNGGNVKVNLSGYKIFFDGTVAYEFDDVSIGSGEKLSVALSGVEVNENSVIELYTDSEELLVQTLYGMLASGEQQLFFSVPAGFYNEEVKVDIYAPENTKVYYTLDGSIPTLDSSLYEETLTFTMQSSEPVFAAKEGISAVYGYVPSSVSKCVVLTAMYADQEGNCSEAIRTTYFIGMESQAAYANMPILSITAEEEALFDYYEGIYVSGREYEDALARGEGEKDSANYYEGWSRDAYLQFFEEEKGITYAAPVLLSVVNDGYAEFMQKSLQVTAVGGTVSEGSTLSDYLKGENGAIVLSNGEADIALKMRRILASSLLENTDITVLDVQPCTVFLNGEYWGMYLMSSSVNEAVIGEKYGIDESNILLIHNGENQDKSETSYTEMYQYITKNDMAIAANYQKAGELLDMENYAEYVCANIFLGNSDWPNQNVSAWRSQSKSDNPYEDGKWRFIWTDVDQIIANSDLSSYSLDTYLRPAIEENQLLYSLMRSEEFRQLFAETMNELMNDIFNLSAVQDELEKCSADYGKAVIATYSRFMGSINQDILDAQIEKMEEFFEERPEYIMTYTQEFLSMDRVFSVVEQEENQ